MIGYKQQSIKLSPYNAHIPYTTKMQHAQMRSTANGPLWPTYVLRRGGALHFQMRRPANPILIHCLAQGIFLRATDDNLCSCKIQFTVVKWELCSCNRKF